MISLYALRYVRSAASPHGSAAATGAGVGAAVVGVSVAGVPQAVTVNRRRHSIMYRRIRRPPLVILILVVIDTVATTALVTGRLQIFIDQCFRASAWFKIADFILLGLSLARHFQ